MALLGFHIVLSLIAATLTQKFPQFTICERLVHKNLKYYFLPEPPDSNDGRFRRKGKNKNDGAVPDYRNQTFSMIMEKEIFTKLSYYSSLLWLVDYALVSIVVFTLCQIFVYFFPNDDSTNVSVLWTIFSTMFALQILFKLLWKKFTNPNLGAERNLIFCFSLISFLLFMSLAENETALHFERSSPLFLFVFASFMASLLGAAFLMPIVQYTSLYRLITEDEKSIKTVFHHIVFLMPIFILPLFFKPVQEHLLNQMPVLSIEHYSAIRTYLIILWALLRIFSTKSLLQVYLENAKEKGYAMCQTCGRLLTPAIVILYTALTLISLGQIFPLNSGRVSNNSSPNYINVILEPQIQRAVWTNGLFAGLCLHSVISLVTIVFGV
ncbi:Transmembrane protein 161A/B family-containing protein [Aphelenchoides bicaudatus]|nr:Transmembrane protein 161A/B family-containing protein [Aphelenchoides bicaudatus]